MEEFFRPQLITPEIEGLLNGWDVEKLTDNEKTVYFRYRYSGPVKYSKSQSLMAVMAVELGLGQDNYSDQLAAILEMLMGKKS
ncbi:hypothetical protein [Pseudoflavitalea rhizosphaerae]|uniref:hypothetical protein n=1 Tax=Pseudoflavitalea rhizosphaerae TaxID=1884793 RepID=UPI000F8C583E|nr:hypothetical protein [Pseudoflavitalea rhizosphaerae]